MLKTASRRIAAIHLQIISTVDKPGNAEICPLKGPLSGVGDLDPHKLNGEIINRVYTAFEKTCATTQKT